MAMKEVTPPPVIGKAGRYTVFITPPATPRPAEASRSYTSSPKFSPIPSPRNVGSEASRTRLSAADVSPRGVDTDQTPSPPPAIKNPAEVQTPPPVQVPPPQYAKGDGKASSGSGVFCFFWDAVAKVKNAHSSLDEYLAEWLGLNQSRYQWALNDYYESNGKAKDGGKPKEVAGKGQAV